MIDLYDYPPPALYDFPYTGPGVTVTVDSPAVVCFGLGVKAKAGDRIYGCSVWAPGGCLIVLPKINDRITGDDQQKVRRVENANCNGWPRGNRE